MHFGRLRISAAACFIKKEEKDLLLASDFDGTLYFEDGIKENDQQAIVHFQKHHLIFLKLR